MSELYKRAWNITIGTVEINDLACDFNVRKTLKAEPNTCSLRIYNLAPDTRAMFTIPGRTTMVRVEAGYGSKLTQLYLGEVRALAPGEINGADIVTELTSGDGEKAMQGARCLAPIGAKTPPSVALQAIAKALGVKSGNVAAAAAKLTASGKTMFARGTVINGNAARALTDFCRSAGLEWSVQDGALQILDLGAGLETFPYILAADSGLIGAPKLASDGKVTAQTLMIPELRPGMRVQFDSLTVKGLYRVEQAVYTGETHGAQWGIQIVCTKPKGVL